MRLNDLLEAIEPLQIIGDTDYLVENIVFDSRIASESSLFVAVVGTSVDGHSFIPNVIEQGCKMIVSEKLVEVPSGITLIVVKDSSVSLALLASKFYGHPSQKLILVGVTGTNGKTTIATLLHALFSKLGYHVGLLSTVVNKIGVNDIPSTHTTPDPISLNHLLSNMVESGCTHCFMEVSSHSIVQHRITGLSFDGGIFTNITHDHLDYHGSFKEYIKAKKLFFDGLPSTAFSLSNIDDKNGGVMLQNTKANKYTYSLKSVSDFKTKIVENQLSGLVLSVDGTEVWTKLIGEFNAYNLLAVYATAILLGEDKLEVLTAISNLHAVVGRFQQVQSKNGIIAIVDYAHTPDALENVLDTISSIRTKNESVITVIGCGGDRDKEKRPKMAAVACEKSNKVILTSDNPRSENPDTIINEMMSGVEGQFFKNTLAITDRSQAIKTACSIANSGDIILIAGKGHETYQEILGVKHPFDDLKLITELFDKMEK